MSHAARVGLPDGCDARLPAVLVERLDTGAAVLTACEHQAWGVRLTDDNGQPVAFAMTQSGARPTSSPESPVTVDPLDPLEVRRHDLVRWLDRMSMAREGRVRSIDSEGNLAIQLPTGATANITAGMVDEVISAEVAGEVPEADDARAAATARYEQGLTARTRAAVTDVHDLLRELDPDGDPDARKMQACLELERAARQARVDIKRMIDDANRAADQAPTDTDGETEDAAAGT